MPGVEVIAGSQTSGQVRARCHELLRRAGKYPIDVASTPAFVANRLQMALFLEAVACVDDGSATPAQVDDVVRTTFGFRLPFYGPFEIADMAGLDTYLAVFRTLAEAHGPRFTPPARLVDLVAAGRRGAKTGAGFGDYSTAERARMLGDRDRRYAAMSALLDEQRREPDRPDPTRRADVPHMPTG